MGWIAPKSKIFMFEFIMLNTEELLSMSLYSDTDQNCSGCVHSLLPSQISKQQQKSIRLPILDLCSESDGEETVGVCDSVHSG